MKLKNLWTRWKNYWSDENHTVINHILNDNFKFITKDGHMLKVTETGLTHLKNRKLSELTKNEYLALHGNSENFDIYPQ